MTIICQYLILRVLVSNWRPDAPTLYNKGNLNWEVLNGGSTFANPVANTFQQVKSITDNLITSLNLAYDILSGLKLSSSFGFNRDEMHELELAPASAFAPPIIQIQPIDQLIMLLPVSIPGLLNLK